MIFMTFDEWFDRQYPEGTFEPDIIRLSLKEVAEKAYYYGLGRGFDGSFDSVLKEKVWQELESFKN